MFPVFRNVTLYTSILMILIDILRYAVSHWYLPVVDATCASLEAK